MIRTALLLVGDLLQFLALVCCSHKRLAAENLFLRKQLAFYVERKVKPRRLNDAARIALVVLARVIDWRQQLRRDFCGPHAFVRCSVWSAISVGPGRHALSAASYRIVKMVIVRDIWLTGFDVPSLHTMYVDKPMRGHGLMQATCVR